MKEVPILFSTEMVKAILKGRKTQTRRVVKPQPRPAISGLENKFDFDFKRHSARNVDAEDLNYALTGIIDNCPYGKVGDVLWVRESCCYVLRDHAHDLLEGSRDNNQWVYKTSVHPDWMIYAKVKYGYKWKPSIHMPRAACRLLLEITDIKVERLHDITEEDAIAEGILSRTNPSVNSFSKPFLTYYDYVNGGFATFGQTTAIESFRSLWHSINGAQSWKDNPWVWVIKFKTLSTTGKPDLSNISQ